MKRVLRVGYITKKYELTKQDIDDNLFELLLNKRKLRVGAIDKMFKNLMVDKHFESPFVVNYRNSKYRLIDGNHRYEAIIKYLNAHPENRVEVTLNIYTDLTDDEEKELFNSWNKGMKQSISDVIQQNKDDIPIYKLMTDPKHNFPVTVRVYASPGTVSFHKLVGAYLGVIKPNFKGSFRGSAWEFVEEAAQLGHKDVKLMSAFMKDFSQAFGPINGNLFLRGTPLVAVFRIWIDNRQQFSYNKLIDLFKSRLYNSWQAKELGRMGGTGAQMYAWNQYVEMINFSRTKDIVIMRSETEDDTGNGDE